MIKREGNRILLVFTLWVFLMKYCIVLPLLASKNDSNETIWEGKYYSSTELLTTRGHAPSDGGSQVDMASFKGSQAKENGN